MQASSSAASKRVIAGISGTIARSCFRDRGKSHVASLPSDASQKRQKRISKQERRVMIEAFVEKYRASNAGKFPTVSAVRQEVGGSYYIAREIVQELEYNHKFPSEKFKAAQHHKASGLNNLSSEVKDEQSYSSMIQTSSDAGSNTSFVEIVENIEIDMHPQLKDDNSNIDLDSGLEGQQVSINTKNVSIKEGQYRGDFVKAAFKEGVHEKELFAKDATKEEEQDHEGSTTIQASDTSASADNIKEVMTEASMSLKLKTADLSHSPGETKSSTLDLSNTEYMKDRNDPTVAEQMERDKVLESDEHDSEHPSKHEHEASSSATTNLWGNLKSFAGGIIYFWKKL